MDKIAYIVPSENMIETVEGFLREDVDLGKVVVQTVDVYDFAGEYRRLCAEGYGVIIARGGIYEELFSCSDTVHVMEERTRTSDIMTVLRQVRETYQEKIYVVLRQTTAKNFEANISLYGFPIEVYRYDTIDSLKRTLEAIEDQNAVVLAAMVCSRKDLKIVEILNQPEAVRETVQVAKGFLEQLQENVQRVNVMESVLDNMDEGIIVFDKAFTICQVNSKLLELTGQTESQLIGTPVTDLIPDMPQKRKDEVCLQNPSSFIRQIGEMMLSFTIHPFQFYRQEQRYLTTVQDVTKIQELERKIRLNLAKRGLVAQYRFSDIKTRDKGMMRLIERSKTIAGFEGSVLIYGDNGTGKELFAQSIHNGSGRKDGPFVAINCAALPESLLESELFGYVSGAFTGARKEGKAGLFELAHTGTIFLDEINSMPKSLQAKLLRVIEEQQVMRVGSDYVIPLDIRIISASNVPLEKDMKDGNFRKDLFYRLGTFRIDIPPVSERKDDIILLFKHYLSQIEEKDPEEIQLDGAFEEALLSHRWNGNVREIKSAALRYHAFGEDYESCEVLGKEMPEDELVDDEFKIDLAQLSKTVEELVIQSLLDKDIPKNQVAKALGISRQALHKKLQKKE